jgi:uncharacterized protein YjiS (DUF1127 family)
MTLFTNLRLAVQKRAAYRRTVYELQGISPRVAEDIGVFPAGAERIAHKAIYG